MFIYITYRDNEKLFSFLIAIQNLSLYNIFDFAFLAGYQVKCFVFSRETEGFEWSYQSGTRRLNVILKPFQKTFFKHKSIILCRL